jgi:hypothetical protein
MYFLLIEIGAANVKLYLMLHGYAILPILWVIGRYSPNEFNVFFRNCGLPGLPLDFIRQKSRNFFFLHRITLSGLMRISLDVQFLQSLDSNNQKSRFSFFDTGFLEFRLYMLSCCLDARIRIHTSLLNHVKASRLRDCMTNTTSMIFMSKVWSHKTPKSNKISRDGVFAEQGGFLNPQA